MTELEEEIGRIVQVLNHNRKLRKEAGMNCAELLESNGDEHVQDYVARIVKGLVNEALVANRTGTANSALGNAWGALMLADAGKTRKVPKKRGRPRIDKNQLTLAISPKDHSLVIEVPEG